MNHRANPKTVASQMLDEKRGIQSMPVTQVTKRNFRGIDLLDIAKQNKGTAFTDEKGEQINLVRLLPDSVEDVDTQLTRLLGHLAQSATELERYLFLINLCGRNEGLFHKILLSDRIRFLLPSDSRRRLLEICSHLRSGDPSFE